MRQLALIVATITLGSAIDARAETANRPAAVSDAATWEELQGGEPVLLSIDSQAKGEKKRILAGIVIDAPAEEIWKVVCDKEAAPDYVKDLKRAEILGIGHDEDGLEFQIVEQEVKLGMLPGTFVYTCKHRLTPFDRIDFKRTGGDLKDIEGFWKFVPIEGGAKTLLIYQLHIDPGMFIPGAVVTGSLRKSLPEALRGIRDQVVLMRAGK